ncbi:MULTISPECIES: heavy metal transporter [unclassified Streptomyces]|uniref:heavy metal transporter n=1 Tax=unclassified Streptomyces TaxID=2593676 RepID=UPI0036753CEF
MPEPSPTRPKRYRRLLRFMSGLLILCGVAAYLVVQYVTGGGGTEGCKVVSGRSDGESYQFTPEQAVNAATIAAVGTGRGMPERAVAIALATSIQESGLLNIKHGDRDSLGLFQQRPSQGWGTKAQILDPAYAAGIFYAHLAKVPDYQTLPLTVAAQRVQRSGYPEAYAKHEEDATLLAAALTGQAAATLTCDGRPAATTVATAVGPDAVRTALVRDFGRDAVEEAGAEVSGVPVKAPTPTPSVTATAHGRTVTVPVPEGKKTDKAGRTESERGWQLAHWAVANSTALHIQRVSYAGREWAAGSTDSQWQATSSQSTGGAEKSAGSVRIVTGQ